MKGIGLILMLAFTAMAMLAVPVGQSSTGSVVAGIDAGGAPNSLCNPEDGLPARGCEAGSSGRIIIASITGTGDD